MREGDLVDFGKLWYNLQSLANILYLSKVHKSCQETMDTATEEEKFIRWDNRTKMKFVASDSHR